MPEGIPSYDVSGWCTFERMIAGVLTDVGRVWDVGRIAAEHLPLFAQDTGVQAMTALTAWCTTSSDGSPFRCPAMTPQRFRTLLDAKTFTNGKEDHDLVASLYEGFLEMGLGAATKLSFPECSWGDADVAALATDVLPLCPRLRKLNISANPFGDAGLAVLVPALPPNLEELLIDGAYFSEASVRHLAQHLPPNVQVLSLMTRPDVDPQGQGGHDGSGGDTRGTGDVDATRVDARGSAKIAMFRRYYTGDGAERAAVLAELAAADAALVTQRRGAGPVQVVLGGVPVWRRIRCESGRAALFAAALGAQPWVISPEEPLVEGAPHYECDLPDGTLLHLYRHDLGASFVKRWMVNVNTVRSTHQCIAGIPADTWSPCEATDAGNFWLVQQDGGEQGAVWSTVDTGFRFVPITAQDGDGDVAVSVTKDGGASGAFGIIASPSSPSLPAKPYRRWRLFQCPFLSGWLRRWSAADDKAVLIK